MMSARRPTLFLLLLVGALLSGCTSKKSENSTSELAAGSSATTSPSGKVVNLAIWSNYINKEFVEEFEKQSGIHVVISNYSSNEELLGKLQAGATGYDVAVPSDYMVFVMAKLGLLTELNLSKISHFAEIESNARGAEYDPKNQYSVPYGRGLTGIAYNKEVVKDPVKSCKDLFENEKYSGRIS
jgi:spermidine/putrescine transport system substrate-binding protein